MRTRNNRPSCRKQGIRARPGSEPGATSNGSTFRSVGTSCPAVQTEINLKTGKKLTRQEILPGLVESTVVSGSEFIDAFRNGKVALAEEVVGMAMGMVVGMAVVAQFNGGMISSGVETDEEDIDDVIDRRVPETLVHS